MMRQIEKIIEASKQNLSCAPYRVLQMHKKLDGLMGAESAWLISRCVTASDKDSTYLEVGIYQGSNLAIIASENRNRSCIGVDNFSEEFQESVGKTETTEQIVQSRLVENDLKNVTIIRSDFREFLSSATFQKSVEVYLFDGPRGYQDQMDGVEMALPLLRDEAIIFVDDWACENVQQATKDLLTKYPDELKLLAVFDIPNMHLKQTFNQGQVCFKYTRKK